MVSRPLVLVGSPANTSGLFQVVGLATASAPLFTMCRDTALAKHSVEVERGGEGAFYKDSSAARRGN